MAHAGYCLECSGNVLECSMETINQTRYNAGPTLVITPAQLSYNSGPKLIITPV